MPQHVEQTGERIARFRKLRQITQQGLATEAAISYSTLTKVEQGVIPASPTVLGAVARALRVQVVELTGQPYLTELQQDELDVLIQPIREAMDVYDLGADPDVRPRSIAELHAEAEELCERVRATDLKWAAAGLPALMLEATAAAYLDPSDAAWRVLASTYRTAYDVTSKLGYPDLCMIALDRLEWAAQRASDPILAGARQYFRTLAYTRTGQVATGRRLIASGLDYLMQAPAGRVRDAVTGQLHLGAAVIAARSGDGSAAGQHIAEARRFAALTGPAETVHWLSFGPTNVEVHNVGILADQERHDEAVEAARAVVVPDGWARSRASAHLAEVARSQLLTGKADKALQGLMRAREMAPQQMRYHPMVRDTIAGLLSARRSSPRSLNNLAAWAGI
ncbi:helix-turn-helix domain-containing protein [Kitasatospora sp. NPDC088548]|uniref:helix-turn-helix domain-containing protein n=1 Tax=Kitasatospora sp. NPDC088548 TaxID=3364075 RepID=UPI003800FB84